MAQVEPYYPNAGQYNELFGFHRPPPEPARIGYLPFAGIRNVLRRAGFDFPQFHAGDIDPRGIQKLSEPVEASENLCQD